MAPLVPAVDDPSAEHAPAPSSEAGAGGAPEHDGGLGVTILPNFGYNADDGFGLGFYTEVTAPPPPGKAVHTSIVVHTYLTTSGFHNQRLRFDFPGLGRGDRMRIGGLFAFRAWLNDGYWGIGNGTTRDTDYLGVLAADDPARRYYHYQLVQPFGHLALAQDISQHASAYAAVDVRYSWVQTYDDSLLAIEEPYGIDGGLALQVGAGLLWDTRDEAIDPHRGALLEAAGRVAVEPRRGVDAFGGPFLAARAWVPFGDDVVFAGRVMGEYLFGHVPFYEMVQWGGFTPTSGFGGAATIRGARFGRWRAPGKAVANAELRCAIGDTAVGPNTLHWHLAPLADVGVVWGAGDPSEPAPDLPLHPAGGLGIRGVWNRDIAARIDTAIAYDPVDDGLAVEPAATWGVYLDFAYMY